MDTPEQGAAEAAADTGPSVCAVTVGSRDSDGPSVPCCCMLAECLCERFRPALRPQWARPVGRAGGGIVGPPSMRPWPRAGTCLVWGCFIRASRLE